MKTQIVLRKSFVLMMVLPVLLVFSCKKSDDGGSDFSYLIEYNQVTVLSQAAIMVSLSNLSLQYSGAAAIMNNTTHNVEVYRITYSTHYGDSAVEASGLVCIPMSASEFPIISFQNATNTASANAPSVNPYRLDYLVIEGMAGNGYVIAMPDYIGFGASAEIVHPYYDRETTNRAIIDMLKAVNELLESDIVVAKGNSRYYLMGYSQGAGATLSVLDAIENEENPGFDIEAASCGSGAYNLVTMTDYLLDQETIPTALYLPYFIYGQTELGSVSGDLSLFFSDPYAGMIPQLFEGSFTSQQINDQLPSQVDELLSSQFITGYSNPLEFTEFKDVVEANSIQAWNTSAMIGLYHGTEDIHVPSTQSSDVYDDFLALGGAVADHVNLTELEGLTHETAVIPWGLLTINWFNSLEEDN